MAVATIFEAPVPNFSPQHATDNRYNAFYVLPEHQTQPVRQVRIVHRHPSPDEELPVRPAVPTKVNRQNITYLFNLAIWTV